MDFTETFWAIALPTKEEVADMEADTTELQSDATRVRASRQGGEEGGSMEGRDSRGEIYFNMVREIQMG